MMDGGWMDRGKDRWIRGWVTDRSIDRDKHVGRFSMNTLCCPDSFQDWRTYYQMLESY